jgi:nicotinamidase-related amidase
MSDSPKPDNSILLVIDIQEKFRTVISDFEATAANINKLIQSFTILNIPIIVTEQYPKGLGSTIKEIKDNLKNYDCIEKTSFDCFNDKSFIELLKSKFINKKNLIICGIESHVCVFQTVLSALRNDFQVYLIADAVSSRKKSDYEIALVRMKKEGVKLASTEMIIFQMIKDSKDINFRAISSIIK